MAHGIFSEPPSDHTDRSYDTVKNDTQNNSGVDPTEHVPDHHPAFVRPEYNLGKREGWSEKTGRQYYGPRSRPRPREEKRPKTDQCKNSPDCQAERTQLLNGNIALHTIISGSLLSSTYS